MGKNNPLTEIGQNLIYGFKPLCRLEYLTGNLGFALAIHGGIKGNGKEIIAGLVVTSLSGLYGAYKDGCFSKPQTNKIYSSDITDQL